MLQVSLREKENSNAKIAVIDREMLLHNISWIVSCCYSHLFNNSVQHIHKRCIWYGKWENVCPDKKNLNFCATLKAKAFFIKILQQTVQKNSIITKQSAGNSSVLLVETAINHDCSRKCRVVCQYWCFCNPFSSLEAIYWSN